MKSIFGWIVIFFINLSTLTSSSYSRLPTTVPDSPAPTDNPTAPPSDNPTPSPTSDPTPSNVEPTTEPTEEPTEEPKECKMVSYNAEDFGIKLDVNNVINSDKYHNCLWTPELFSVMRVIRFCRGECPNANEKCVITEYDKYEVICQRKDGSGDEPHTINILKECGCTDKSCQEIIDDNNS